MPTAYDYCIYLLARQDYSEFKLRQKLRQKLFASPEIDETLLRLKTLGYLKEASYRRLFIRKWMMKGESEDKIRQRGAMEKLEFASEEFELVRKELGSSELDSIEKLVTKKLRNKAIPQDFVEQRKLRDKTLRFLISKGHAFDDARRAISRWFLGHGGETPHHGAQD
jgi:regulatory protein